jgi:hypothetical protein
MSDSTPDPTLLTTEALQREVNNLKEIIKNTDIATREIMNEKFHSVDQQFVSAERARIEQKADTKAAVDAALIAQKEAVREQTLASEKAIAKSEVSTNSKLEESDKRVDDLKTRVGTIESIKRGGKEATASIYAFAGFVVTLIVIGGFLIASTKG